MDQAEDIVAGISEAAIRSPDPKEPEAVLRDPKDEYLVALAKASDADAIVTGDRDLLEHPGLKPPAIGSRAACELLGLITPSERN